jgi:membrane-associated phospholipid phosphatase
MQMDAVDIVTAPLHAFDHGSILRSPDFYIAAAGVGAIWGGSYALDQTVRARLRSMKPSTASALQNIGYGGVGALSALTYGYGLYADDQKVRDTMLTAGEATGVATLLAEFAFKPIFGRLRPRQDHHSHTQFFDGGQSFPSGEVTPMFSLAAGVSESFDNRWFIALPVYSLATADAFGRMGHDAHWLSDVVGAALLGWGTTELFIHMHRKHAMENDRWRIFAVSAPDSRGNQNRQNGMGLGISYSW